MRLNAAAEAAFPVLVVPHVSVMSMPALRMRQCQPVHEIRERAVFAGQQHQMPMVGQDTLSQDGAWAVLHGLGQDMFERLVVAGFLEDRQPAIAAVEHMIDRAHWGRA